MLHENMARNRSRSEQAIKTLTLGGANGATTSIFVQRYDPSRQSGLRPHVHRFHEIVFVEEGSGSHVVDGDLLDANEGDVFWIAPGAAHDPRGLADTSRWIVAFHAEAVVRGHPGWTSMGGESADVRLRAFGGPEGPRHRRFRLSSRERASLVEHLDAMKRELSDRTAGYEHAARALLELVLVDGARKESEADDAANARTTAGDPVDRALTFIDTRFRDPIGLRDVAKASGRSPAYLTDLVRRRTGRTVMQWIAERRIEEARRILLASPGSSIEEVADAVGYGDAAHFHRAFRARVGMPPGVFRRRNGL